MIALNLFFSTLSRLSLLRLRGKPCAPFSTRSPRFQDHTRYNRSNGLRINRTLTPAGLTISTCIRTAQSVLNNSIMFRRLNTSAVSPLIFNYNYIDNPRISFKHDLLSIPLSVTSDFDQAMANAENQDAVYFYMPGCFHQKLDYEVNNKIRRVWYDFTVARQDITTEEEYQFGIFGLEMFDQYYAVSHEQIFAGTLLMASAQSFDNVAEEMFLAGYDDLLDWLMYQVIESINSNNSEFREPQPFTCSEPQSKQRQWLVDEGLRALKGNLEILRYTASAMDKANYTLWKDLYISSLHFLKAESIMIADLKKSHGTGTYFDDETSQSYRKHSIATVYLHSTCNDKNDNTAYDAVKSFLDLNAIITVYSNDLFSTWKETVQMPLNPFSPMLRDIHNGMSAVNTLRKYNNARNLAVRDTENMYQSNSNHDERTLMWKAGAYRERLEHFSLSATPRYGFKACYT